MKRKDFPEFDNVLFADMIRRYIHKEIYRDILTDYYCDEKSTTTISRERDMSTRQVWNIKEKYEDYLFDLYERLYP